MASNFSFDEAKSFDENFQAYLDAATEIDEQMAKILRDNSEVLARVVREGERDTAARAEFNTAIAQALDALTTNSSPSDSEE